MELCKQRLDGYLTKTHGDLCLNINEEDGEDPSTFRTYDSVTIQVHLPFLSTVQNHRVFPIANNRNIVQTGYFFFFLQEENLLPYVNEKPGS